MIHTDVSYILPKLYRAVLISHVIVFRGEPLWWWRLIRLKCDHGGSYGAYDLLQRWKKPQFTLLSGDINRRQTSLSSRVKTHLSTESKMLRL